MNMGSSASAFVALVAAAATLSVGAATPTPAHRTFDFKSYEFVQDPARGVIYATAPATNAVKIIDANTLQVVKSVIIGSSPKGLALSDDGSKLYVATSGANFLGVMDTNTRTALEPIAVPAGRPTGVQVGTNNRLWVLTGDAIIQIDATTGARTGGQMSTYGEVPGVSISGGQIKVTADRQTLYYGKFGSSPSSMFKFDVSGALAVKKWEATTGSNGQDLALSHDEKLVAHPNGAPYEVSLYRTSDKLAIGSLATGHYPRSFAFSPDDRVGYAGTDGGVLGVQAYNLSTQLKTNTIYTASQPSELFVDKSGRYLFVSVDGATQVFTTARSMLGDATVDGQVNFDDLLKLAQNYNDLSGTRGWSHGDFTGDGCVDFDDLLDLAQHYNTRWDGQPLRGDAVPASFDADWAAALARVPEPGAATAALALAGAALAHRPCRGRRRVS